MEDGGNVMEGMVTDIETQHQTNVEHYLEVFQQWRNKNSRPYTMVYCSQSTHSTRNAASKWTRRNVNQ